MSRTVVLIAGLMLMRGSLAIGFEVLRSELTVFVWSGLAVPDQGIAWLRFAGTEVSARVTDTWCVSGDSCLSRPQALACACNGLSRGTL